MSTFTNPRPIKRKTVTTVTHYRIGKDDKWIAEAKTVTEEEYEVDAPVEHHPIVLPGSVPYQPYVPHWTYNPHPYAPPPFGPATC